MSYRNAGRRNQTKGIVLFTVVAIMLFLLIMVLSTLSVVSSAQRRTYTQFKENQAYFTARSGIATFLRAAAAGPTETTLVGFHDEFLDLCQNGNVYNDKGKSFETMESSSDVMTVTVSFPQPPQSGGDLKYLYGECKIYVFKTGLDKAKIISRATLGDSESIVTLYISVPKPKPELFKNAMTSFSSVANSHVAVLGGLGAYVDPDQGSKAYSDKAEKTTLNFTNEGVISRNNIIGSGATISTQSSYVFQETVGKLKSDGSYEETNGYMGITVMGDLHIQNNPIFYGVSSSKRPYIYADGCFSSPNGLKIGASVGSGIDVRDAFNGTLNASYGDLSDDDDAKINVYCNSADIGTIQINGDLFIYGENEDRDYAYMTGNGKDKTLNKFNGVIYGDIYCNGDLTLGDNAVINGDVYCSGTLSYNNLSSSNVSGEFYAASYSISGSSDIVDGTDKYQSYSSMPSEFIDKDTVKESIISVPTKQHSNFYGQDKDGNPVPGTIYPAYGYYTDDSGNWKERTSVDSSWSIWNPNDHFTFDGQVEFIDATTNDLNIVVNNGIFAQNRKNCKLVIKGDKRVDFYFTEKAPNPWWPGDNTKYVKTTNGGGDGSNNMVITEAVYDAINSGSEIHIACADETDNISVSIYYNIQDNLTFDMCSDLLMGYIYGPNAIAVMNNGISFPNIKYDGIKYKNIEKIHFIGSCVTSDIQTGNNLLGIFLPPAAPNTDGDGKFWTDLYYLNY